MSRTDTTTINLNDSGRVVTWINDQLQGDPAEHKPVYSIKLSIEEVGYQGRAYHSRDQPGPVYLHVERETLIKAGYMKPGKNDPNVEPEETVADLLVRLLEKAGFEQAE